MIDRAKPSKATVADAYGIIADLERRAPDVRSLLVTGSDPGVGATTLAFAFAGAASRISGKRTLLIDADPRTGLTELASARSFRGLRDLEGPVLPHPTLDVDWAAGVDILPRGQGSARMADLVASRVIDGIVERAREAKTWVIWDTAPIRECSDTKVLLGTIGVALLVVEADRTLASSAAGAIQEIDNLNAHLACVVLTGAGRLRCNCWFG